MNTQKFKTHNDCISALIDYHKSAYNSTINSFIAEAETTGFIYSILRFSGTGLFIRNAQPRKRGLSEISCAQISGTPITVFHPEQMVNKDNVKDLIVGTCILSLADEDNKNLNVIAQIFDPTTIEDFKQGKFKSTSDGCYVYTVVDSQGLIEEIDFDPNHLALLSNVGDGFWDNLEDFNQEKEENMSKINTEIVKNEATPKTESDSAKAPEEKVDPKTETTPTVEPVKNMDEPSKEDLAFKIHRLEEEIKSLKAGKHEKVENEAPPTSSEPAPESATPVKEDGNMANRLSAIEMALKELKSLEEKEQSEEVAELDDEESDRMAYVENSAKELAALTHKTTPRLGHNNSYDNMRSVLNSYKQFLQEDEKALLVPNISLPNKTLFSLRKNAMERVLNSKRDEFKKQVQEKKGPVFTERINNYNQRELVLHNFAKILEQDYSTPQRKVS